MRRNGIMCEGIVKKSHLAAVFNGETPTALGIAIGELVVWTGSTPPECCAICREARQLSQLSSKQTVQVIHQELPRKVFKSEENALTL